MTPVPIGHAPTVKIFGPTSIPAAKNHWNEPIKPDGPWPEGYIPKSAILVGQVRLNHRRKSREKSQKNPRKSPYELP